MSLGRVLGWRNDLFCIRFAPVDFALLCDFVFLLASGKEVFFCNGSSLNVLTVSMIISVY